MQIFKRCMAFVCAVALLSAASIWLFEEEREKHAHKIASFSSFGYLSEQSMILDSDLIVRGKVAKIADGKWRDGYRIETEVLVKVLEVLSGTFEEKQVKVRFEDGYNKEANICLESTTAPSFSRGEEVVLFLHEVPEEGHFRPIADYYGKYTVKDGYLDRDAELDSELFYMTVDELKARIQEEKQQ